MKRLSLSTLSCLVAVVCLLGPAPGHSAQTPGGSGQRLPDAVVVALRGGGHVLVMRHARSPRETPTRAEAQPDNVNLERQLDAEGREGAIAMGQALRAIGVPIRDVLTSPTYRAVETVRLLGFSYSTAAELGDGGQSMQPVTPAQGEWLRARAARRPGSGSTLIVTHQPNLAMAFPEWGPSVADGETVVLLPDGRGGTTMVARIPIELWRLVAPSALAR